MESLLGSLLKAENREIVTLPYFAVTRLNLGLNLIQRLIQISDDIVSIFDPNRDAH